MQQFRPETDRDPRGCLPPAPCPAPCGHMPDMIRALYPDTEPG